MLKLNYKILDYYYDTQYSCEESGCHEEGICRCQKIIYPHVKSVDLMKITKEISDQLSPTEYKSKLRDSAISQLLYGGKKIDEYCIYRILVIHKVFDPENWTVNVVSGYYGEEVENITISKKLMKKVEIDCLKLLKLQTLEQKLKFTLELEYGKLIDSVVDSDFEIINISKSEIDFNLSNQNHIKKIKDSDLSYLKSYNLPRGIIIGESPNYKIIDGFHRIIADRSDKFEVFLVKK